MPAISTSPLLGVNLSQVDTTAQYAPGTLSNCSDGGMAMYVLSSTSAISTYAAVAIDGNGKANMLTTTNAASSPRCGFSQVSIATGAYGWVRLGGAAILVNLAANCAPNVALFTTATPGVLDDATVTLGYVMGLVANNTISNATAVTCIGLSPHVGRGGNG